MFAFFFWKNSFEIMANLCDLLSQKPLNSLVTKKSKVRKMTFSTFFRSQTSLKSLWVFNWMSLSNFGQFENAYIWRNAEFEVLWTLYECSYVFLGCIRVKKWDSQNIENFLQFLSILEGINGQKIVIFLCHFDSKMTSKNDHFLAVYDL